MPKQLSPPPTSPYGTLHGSIFMYHRNLIAFESPFIEAEDTTQSSLRPNKCILMGGLSDGLLPCPYTQRLEETCNELEDWSLVQPLISSSYLGFGNGDLDRDTEELNRLLLYLRTHRAAKSVAMVGHSTGCQNAVHYLKYGEPDLIDMVGAVILQAPVSDREGPMNKDQAKWKKEVDLATQMVESDSKGQEMMPRSAFWAPITAKRFLDLQGVGHADDFFSSDYTDEQLAERLGHVGVLPNLRRVLVAFSGADEYIVKGMDTELQTKRLAQAMNGKRTDYDESESVAQPLHLPNANHNLSEGEVDVFIARTREALRLINT